MSPEESAELVLAQLKLSIFGSSQRSPEPVADNKRLSQVDFAWWLALSCAVACVRGMSDALPWEGINIAVHMLILGGVFYIGGRTAAFGAWIATLFVDYLLIAPTFSLGVQSTRAALELLAWQVSVAILIIVIARGFNGPSRRLM